MIRAGISREFLRPLVAWGALVMLPLTMCPLSWSERAPLREPITSESEPRNSPEQCCPTLMCTGTKSPEGLVQMQIWIRRGGKLSGSAHAASRSGKPPGRFPFLAEISNHQSLILKHPFNGLALYLRPSQATTPHPLWVSCTHTCVRTVWGAFRVR